MSGRDRLSVCVRVFYVFVPFVFLPGKSGGEWRWERRATCLLVDDLQMCSGLWEMSR